ncbi:MAG: hybrid sensor histidine kinase/response regulator [Myxococcales bacterium]|nr:hybrid sensor histidine kinase/response regulator [Myxococcales bacterium]
MDSLGLLDRLRIALEAGDLQAARKHAADLKNGLGPESQRATQLAAEVLHELRQPLLGIKAYAQMLRDDPSSRTPVPLMLAQVERMEQIISDFTRLASDKPAPKEPVRLSEVVSEAERLFRLSPEAARIQLEVDASAEVEVTGSGRLLEQLVLNLLNNARDAMSGLGRIKVWVGREAGKPALCVADWGPGISPEQRERIFEPYVTSRPKGSGLGLAVCRRVAQEHRATLSLAPPTALPDKPPPATVFRLVFDSETGAASHRRPRILVVDDEAIVRSVFADLLGREAEVVQAETAEQAIPELLDGRFDLIVTDKNLPGQSGLDLAKEARRLDPRSRVIVMTGYPSLVTAQQAAELGVLDYLLKPFDDIRQVREKIRAAVLAPPQEKFRASNRRVDVYEDNSTCASQVVEALRMAGMEPNVVLEAMPKGQEPPAAVVVSWDFGPAYGPKSVELGRSVSRGAPFVVLAEHLTMDSALEALRGGAVACLPKLVSDVKALSRELSRSLKLE